MNIKYFKTYEPLLNHDEDAPPIAQDNVLIICDGMGGTGANKHNYKDEIKTSAYLGSRFTSKFVKQFISLNREKLFSSDLDNIIIDLKNYLHKQLRNIVVEYNFIKRIKGKILELLPTTMFTVVFNQKDDGNIEVVVIWAGDSRIYMLNEQGMMQVTKDNINMDNDALQNMVDSSTVSNNINAEEELNFELYYYKFDITCPTVIFACSDGLFDYANTPMHFEQSILKCIMSLDNSNSSTDFSFLGDAIGKHLRESGLHDDCSLAGACIGFEDIFTLQNTFKERLELVNDICDTYMANFKEYCINKQQITDALKISQNKKIVEDTTENFKHILSDFIKEQCDDIGVKQSSEQLNVFEPYIKTWTDNNSDFVSLIQNIYAIKGKICDISSENTKFKSEQLQCDKNYNDKFQECFLNYRFKEIQEIQENYFIISNIFFETSPIVEYARLLQENKSLIKYKNELQNKLNQFINNTQNGLNNQDIVRNFITTTNDIIDKIYSKYNCLKKWENTISCSNNKLTKLKSKVEDYIMENEYPKASKYKENYLSKPEFASARELKDKSDMLSKEIEKSSNNIEKLSNNITNRINNFIRYNINDIIENVFNSIEIKEQICKLETLSPKMYKIFIQYWELNQAMENINNQANNYYNKCMDIWYKYKSNYEFFNTCGQSICNTKIKDRKVVNV